MHIREAACLLLLSGCDRMSQGMLARALSGAGDDTDDPTVAAVMFDGHAACSGVLLAPDVVATSAHCLIGHGLPRVAFGAIPTDEQALPVLTSAIHPGFDGAHADNDLALLLLGAVGPAAPLGWANVDRMVPAAELRLVGFGHVDAADDGAHQKRAGSATLGAIGDRVFSVAPDPTLPCPGDSGGPALSGGEIVGLASQSDCLDSAGYTRLDVLGDRFILPFVAHTRGRALGDRCWADDQCVSGACRSALDEPELSFCSQPCRAGSTCPAGLACVAGGWCLPVPPSPGHFGTACAFSSDCLSASCARISDGAGVCSDRPCAADGSCAAGLTCVQEIDRGRALCVPAEPLRPWAPTSGCDLGGGNPATALGLALLLLWLLRLNLRRMGVRP